MLSRSDTVYYNCHNCYTSRSKIRKIHYWSTRPTTVPACSDHYFHRVCTSVPKPFKIKRQSLPAGTVGWPSGSLMTPVLLHFLCLYLMLISWCRYLKFKLELENKILSLKIFIFVFCWFLIALFQLLHIFKYQPMHTRSMNPPDPGRINSHYFHTWCPSLRPSVHTYVNAAWILLGH